MKNILGFSVLFLMLIGCNPVASYNVEKIIDNFEGCKYVRLKNNFINTGSAIKELHFDVKKTIREHSSVFSLVIVTYRKDWLLIRSGESLILSVDDKTLKFSGLGSIDNCIDDGKWAIETAYYNITADQLKQIANAKSVIVKLEGKYYYAKGEFTLRNFYNLRKFVNDYVD